MPSRSILSLARREAEIAIRMRVPPDEGRLVVRRLARMRVALYAARGLVEEGIAPDLSRLPYIGLARPVDRSQTTAALAAMVGDGPPAANARRHAAALPRLRGRAGGRGAALYAGRCHAGAGAGGKLPGESLTRTSSSSCTRTWR
jgi:hypothetical protein